LLRERSITDNPTLFSPKELPMMISPAANPYAAAAALDRQLRSPGPPGDASSDNGRPDGGPDVVVTLSPGASAPPSTYDASGKLPGAPTLDDLGANAPDSMAQAKESQDDGDDDATSADSTAAATGSASADSNANVDEDAAVAA
jgi:hypothetical protein